MATKLAAVFSLPNNPIIVVPGKKRATFQNLQNLLLKLVGSGSMDVTTVELTPSAVAASGTVTAASAQAADTVTVAGVAFTAVSGSPTGNQFDISGSDTAAAASLASAINASATAGINGVVSATSSGAVVTVTAKVPGLIGNGITLASSNGTRLATSGARLASGAGTLTSFGF